ncbi:MAG TPA: 50S ribosomal protein L9 [Mycobacteriales bacterium]|nr:50S ribosomal protein L9 [Mycobacteriales bacterium]
MKLILNQDVAGLGAPGDVVEVKDGYGRNYLVPQGLAQRWTKGADKQIATIRRARQVREVRDLGSAQEIRDQLATLTVRLPARSGEGDRLFGSVTTSDIVEAVTKAGGPTLDKRLITLSSPIKSLGSHQVAVKVHPEVDATLTVDVVRA